MWRRGLFALLLIALVLGLVGCSSTPSSGSADSPALAPSVGQGSTGSEDGEAKPLTAAQQVEFAIKPQVGEKMFVDGPAPDGEREAVLYERCNNFTSSGDPRWTVVDSSNEVTFDRYEFSDGSAIVFHRESRDMVDYLKSYDIE